MFHIAQSDIYSQSCAKSWRKQPRGALELEKAIERFAALTFIDLASSPADRART
jgi:hypothetical protein